MKPAWIRKSHFWHFIFQNYSSNQTHTHNQIKKNQSWEFQKNNQFWIRPAFPFLQSCTSISIIWARNILQAMKEWWKCRKKTPFFLNFCVFLEGWSEECRSDKSFSLTNYLYTHMMMQWRGGEITSRLSLSSLFSMKTLSFSH
jgi:hypothetical protein